MIANLRSFDCETLLVSTKRNVWKIVWRIWILMLECKG